MFPFILKIKAVAIFSWISFSVLLVNGKAENNQWKCENFCKVPTKSCGQIIPNLPHNYEVKMLLTSPNRNSTAYVLEYNDDDNRRSVIKHFLDGEEVRTYLDIKEQKVLNVSGIVNDEFKMNTVCNGKPYTYNKMNFLFGYEYYGKLQINRNGGLLNYNGEMYFEYVNETTVRRIPADHWKGCFCLEEVQGEFQVDFYWSVRNTMRPNDPVIPATGDSTVPLKFTIQGRYLSDGYFAYEDVNEIYEIVWFKQVKNFPPYLFELPHGVYCPGFKNNKEMPNIPERFSMRLETIFENTQDSKRILENFNVWYDMANELTLMEYRDQEQNEAEVTIQNIVIDFKKNISYTMDTYRSTCKISSLSTSQGSGFGDRHFRTPKEYFFLNINNYEYIGQYQVRELPCDAWAGRSSDESMTVEWSFLDETWQVDDYKKIEKRIPVQLVARQSKEKKNINIFNFRANPIDFPIDVGSCFKENEKRHFQVTLKGPNIASAALREEIRHRSRIDFASTIQVSPIRIDNVYVDIVLEDETFIVEFTLLAPPQAPDVTPDPSEPSLDAATEKLANQVESKSLMVSVNDEAKNKLYTFVALPGTLHELESRKKCQPAVILSSSETLTDSSVRALYANAADRAPPHLKDPANQGSHESNMDKYNAGQLAGIAVGMFVLGGTIGILAMLLLLMRIDRASAASDQISLYPSQCTPVETPVTEESVVD